MIDKLCVFSHLFSNTGNTVTFKGDEKTYAIYKCDRCGLRVNREVKATSMANLAVHQTHPAGNVEAAQSPARTEAHRCRGGATVTRHDPRSPDRVPRIAETYNAETAQRVTEDAEAALRAIVRAAAAIGEQS